MFLDYLYLEPTRLGFDVLLPNVRNAMVLHDAGPIMTLQVHKRHWDFRGDRRLLTFDPTRRLLYIGENHVKDAMWLAMVPNHLIGLPADGKLNARSKTNTVMRAEDARAVIAFLAYCLHKLGQRDFAMTKIYPDISDEAKLKSATPLV